MSYNAKTYGQRHVVTGGGYPRDDLVTIGFHALLTEMASAGFVSFTQSATAPVSPDENDLWYKPDTGLTAENSPAGDSAFYRYDGAQWVAFSPSEFASYLLFFMDIAPGGGGAGPPLEAVGTGVAVYKGNDGVNDEIRAVKGLNGVAAAVGTDTGDIEVSLATQAAWSLMLRNSATNGVPAGTKISGLTDDPTPALADILVLEKDATGVLRGATLSAIGNTIRGGTEVVAVLVVDWDMPTSCTVVRSFGVDSISITGGGNNLLNVVFDGALADTFYEVRAFDGAASHAVELSQHISARTVNGFTFDNSGTGYDVATNNLCFIVTKV